MSTEGTNLLQFKSSLATCLLGNFERGPSSILVTLKLKVLVPRYLPVYYVHFLGFRVWWKVSSAWTFFAKKKKNHLQQHSHLVKNKMTLFADTPTAHPSWGLRGCLSAPEEPGDTRRGYCSISQSCPTLCNCMDCSTPGFPVLHHLPEFAQTHVHLSR